MTSIKTTSEMARNVLAEGLMEAWSKIDQLSKGRLMFDYDDVPDIAENTLYAYASEENFLATAGLIEDSAADIDKVIELMNQASQEDVLHSPKYYALAYVCGYAAASLSEIESNLHTTDGALDALFAARHRLLLCIDNLGVKNAFDSGAEFFE